VYVKMPKGLSEARSPLILFVVTAILRSEAAVGGFGLFCLVCILGIVNGIIESILEDGEPVEFL
jgi:hypothetical protein